MPGQLSLKSLFPALTHLPLADLWKVGEPYTVRHLHNGAVLLHNRKVMLDDWLGDGILVEEGDGAVYGFFSAFPLNCILGALAWV